MAQSFAIGDPVRRGGPANKEGLFRSVSVTAAKAPLPTYGSAAGGAMIAGEEFLNHVRVPSGSGPAASGMENPVLGVDSLDWAASQKQMIGDQVKRGGPPNKGGLISVMAAKAPPPTYSSAAGGAMIAEEEFLNLLGFQSAGVRARNKTVVGSPDRTVSQKQMRMIKNRESAARSRERKQAYISNLETLVDQLERQIPEIEREEEEHYNQMYKLLIKNVIPVTEGKKPKPALRRTASFP